MEEDKARGITDQTPFEDRPRLDRGTVQGPAKELGFGQQAVAGVEVERTHDLLCLEAVAQAEIGGDRLLTTEREDAFLPIFREMIEQHPYLPTVFEHVSTANAVELIKTLGLGVAGTITTHHLTDTLNSVLGDGVHPHNMCMPVPKSYDDRDALIEAATSDDPQFFFGSDSAPHPQTRKECSHGMCGQFTVPVALPILAEVFEKEGALDKLEAFTSEFGARFYGLPLNSGTVTLVREEWEVPEFYGSDTDRNMQFVPPNAGKTLQWKVIS